MSPGGGKGRPKKALGAEAANRPRRRTGDEPVDERRPRREFRPGDDEHRHLSIRLTIADVGGPWCFSKATPEQWREWLGFIAMVEKMTVDEAQRGGHPLKDYKVEDLPSREARERLVELGYDDETQISRLRIRGPLCVYGFRRGDRFYALWWDPTHSIWPSKLKHT